MIPTPKMNELCWKVQNLDINLKWILDNFKHEEVSKLKERFPLLFMGLRIWNDLERDEKDALLKIVSKQLGCYDPVEDKIEW